MIYFIPEKPRDNRMAGTNFGTCEAHHQEIVDTDFICRLYPRRLTKNMAS